MAEEPYLSTLFAEWLRLVAARLAAEGHVRLSDVPSGRLPAVLARWDGGPDGAEMRDAHVEAVVDLFGYMDATELRDHASRSDVQDSLAIDLLRWAHKLEGFEIPRLAAASHEMRCVLIL